VFLGPHEYVCGPMSVWGPTSVFGAPRLCLGPHGCVWGPTGVFGAPRVCLGPHECVWGPTSVLGAPRVCLGRYKEYRDLDSHWPQRQCSHVVPVVLKPCFYHRFGRLSQPPVAPRRGRAIAHLTSLLRCRLDERTQSRHFFDQSECE
jgi:hypothetical protein